MQEVRSRVTKLNWFWDKLTDTSAKIHALSTIDTPIQCTAGPVIIESPSAEKPVSTGALRALDGPLVVQTKI